MQTPLEHVFEQQSVPLAHAEPFALHIPPSDCWAEQALLTQRPEQQVAPSSQAVPMAPHSPPVAHTPCGLQYSEQHSPPAAHALPSEVHSPPSLSCVEVHTPSVQVFEQHSVPEAHELPPDLQKPPSVFVPPSWRGLKNGRHVPPWHISLGWQAMHMLPAVPHATSTMPD